MDYTDYIVKIMGKEEFSFRHYAPSIFDLLSEEDEFIFDIYESQWIRKSEIIYVRYDPRPYVAIFYKAHGRFHKDLTELWEWVEDQEIN